MHRGAATRMVFDALLTDVRRFHRDEAASHGYLAE